MDCLGYFRDEHCRLIRCKRLVSNQLREVSPVDIIHGEEWQLIELADFMQPHNVRVPQPRGRFRFSLKTVNLLWTGKPPREDHFYGHDAIERNLASAVDNAHSSTRDFFK